MSFNLIVKLLLLTYEVYGLIKDNKNAESSISNITERLRIEKQKSEPNYSDISVDLSNLFDKLN